MEKHIDLKKIGEIISRLPPYKKAKAKAIEIIRKSLQQSKKPYISVSGGKDSIALLALVSEQAKILKKEFWVWSHVSDASFPGTRETIKKAWKKSGGHLIVDESIVSAFDVYGKQSDKLFGKSGYFFESIKQFTKSGNYDMVFLGTRGHESKRRYRAAKGHGPIYQSSVPCKIVKSEPLIWMKIEHVAGVLYEYDYPIHPIYEKIPVGNDCIRLGYITAKDLIHKGTIVFLRLNYPELYYKLCEVAPEVENYT